MTKTMATMLTRHMRRIGYRGVAVQRPNGKWATTFSYNGYPEFTALAPDAPVSANMRTIVRLNRL